MNASSMNWSKSYSLLLQILCIYQLICPFVNCFANNLYSSSTSGAKSFPLLNAISPIINANEYDIKNKANIQFSNLNNSIDHNGSDGLSTSQSVLNNSNSNSQHNVELLDSVKSIDPLTNIHNNLDHTHKSNAIKNLPQHTPNPSLSSININPKIKLDTLKPRATKDFPKLSFLDKLTFQWVQPLMYTGK